MVHWEHIEIFFSTYSVLLERSQSNDSNYISGKTSNEIVINSKLTSNKTSNKL